VIWFTPTIVRHGAGDRNKESEVVLRSYVGAPVKRKEDPRLITGSSIYVDDITLPGMVHLPTPRSSTLTRPKRSPCPGSSPW
jgi:hypothetical protein